MGKQRRTRGPRPHWEPTAAPVPVSAPVVEPTPSAQADVPATVAPSVAVDEPVHAAPVAASVAPVPESPAEPPSMRAADEPSPPEPVDAPAIVFATASDAGSEATQDPSPAAEPAIPAVRAPAEIVLAAPTAPVFALAPIPDDGPSAPEAPFRPVRPLARGRLTFAPERFDFVGIGATIAGYMHGESAAAAAHLRALGGVRSPADMIRLQVGEMQRAADASLTCWAIVARKASRVFAYR